MAIAYGAVHEILQRRFGGPVRDEQTVLTVGLIASEVAARDPERVSLLFVNLGASELFLANTPSVSSTRGIRLGPLGGLVAFDIYEDAVLPAVEWYAIGAAAELSLWRLLVRRETAVEQPGG